MSPNKRKLLLVPSLLMTIVLVWWAQWYDPMSGQLQDLQVDIERIQEKVVRQSEKLKRLTEQIQEEGNIDRRLSELSKLRIVGKRIEDVHAATQSLFQQIFEKNGVAIKTYKELPAGKFRSQTLARIEIQFDTNLKPLSDILEQIDAIPQLVQVEKLTIHYRRTKETDLNVVLQIGTLMIENGGRETSRNP